MPVTITLPNENASDVIARVQASGSGSNVAIAFAKHFEVIPMLPGGNGAGSELVISQDLSMGMLLLRIQQNPGKNISLKLRDREAELPSVNLELSYA
jgi:hypothetical protein